MAATGHLVSSIFILILMADKLDHFVEVFYSNS